jgi:hypothetical protein
METTKKVNECFATDDELKKGQLQMVNNQNLNSEE